jgi:hypothetical protein
VKQAELSLNVCAQIPQGYGAGRPRAEGHRVAGVFESTLTAEIRGGDGERKKR